MPLWLKRGLVVPKVLLQKLYFPFPKEMDFRLLHGSNPKPQVPLSTLVGVRSTRKPFLTLRPLERTKSGKNGQNANIGTYVLMGHQSPYDMAYTQIEGLIVIVYKYTYFGPSPPLDRKPIMHAYGHVCKRQNWHTCLQRNII